MLDDARHDDLVVEVRDRLGSSGASEEDLPVVETGVVIELDVQAGGSSPADRGGLVAEEIEVVEVFEFQQVSIVEVDHDAAIGKAPIIVQLDPGPVGGRAAGAR